MPPPPSLPDLAARFLRLGACAFGGPVVQIATLHDEFVVRTSAVDEGRFRRALAVYQALPGPEATEMCIWVGTVLRGRIGGLVAGLAFVLPGLALMLVACALLFALEPWPPAVRAAFLGMQAAVVALVVRAAWRLFAIATNGDPWLRGIAISAALGAWFEVSFAASLVGGGLLAAAMATRRDRLRRAATLLVPTAWLVVGAIWHGSAPVADAAGIGAAPPNGELLATGLRAGLLTFGGAYTVIPFLQADAVGAAGWMTNERFLAGLAIGGVLPAPMVIVGTWVGWAGGGLTGAMLLTLGIFLPAFVLPLALHERLERAAANVRWHAFLDGVTAAVTGIVAAVAARLVAGLESPFAAVLAIGALAALTMLRMRLAASVVLTSAALVGMLAG
ncbi:MAG: chromate efflux transporter [Planctomycetes bacterium]|nr:chromate efflux transporter [Planctomycetota bacterium]